MNKTQKVETTDIAAGLDLAVAVVEAGPGCVLLLDSDMAVRAASRAFCQSFDLNPSTVAGQSYFALNAGAWDVPPMCALLDAAPLGKSAETTFTLNRAGHAPAAVVAKAERLACGDRPLLHVAHAPAGGHGPLAQTYQPSDALLLREARHRIANGLQIVGSLLLRGSRLSEDDNAKSQLMAAYIRVMAVATLERRLAGASEDEVDLNGYLTGICEHIGEAAISNPARLMLSAQVEPIMVSMSMAASLGMIVTELVMNALKHAFPDDLVGSVVVAFNTQGDDWTLTVADDGVGMPLTPGPRGLGTEIVDALAAQLGATVALSNAAPGKRTSIVFLGPQ